MVDVSYCSGWDGAALLSEQFCPGIMSAQFLRKQGQIYPVVNLNNLVQLAKTAGNAQNTWGEDLPLIIINGIFVTY